MTLLVQKYLETHSLAQLKADHGVNHRICGDKFSLNYDMLEASNTDPLACECRGVILSRFERAVGFDDISIVGDTEIMCRTMPRFFNHGQDCAADINFEARGTKFYEKLDGTMCALYFDFHKNEWHVATRSVPEADLPMDGFDDMTFRGLFEKALHATTGKDLEDWHRIKVWASGQEHNHLNNDLTYVFELCTPVNRIVVASVDYKVTLLAALNNLSGEEYEIEKFNMHGVPICQTYELSNLADMIEFVSARNPTEYEGIVAVDKNFNRVKVKNPGYLALSRVKDSAMRSPRALVELCLLGKLDDALPLLPEHVVHRANKIEEGLRALIRNFNGQYDKVLYHAILMIEDRGWDAHDEKQYRKAMALSVSEVGAHMPYIMMKFAGRISSFSEFIKLQVDPKTGQYKKSFLDMLLGKLDAQ